MIRLSQCMIVKNEEKNIERALSWGKDIMWEQIVVDTGSTDRTADIAEKMGAKLFHFEWIDDFAAAKNYAIEQASGDWIIFLDADEYFSPEDARKLPQVLSKLSDQKQNAVTAGWIQVDGSPGNAVPGTVVRIFRNQPGLCYQGRIHEQLSMKGGDVVCLDASDILSILHTGYSPAEMEEKKKTERNIRLLKKEAEEEPENYKILAHLGGSYFEQREYEEAAFWYEKAVCHMPEASEEESIQDAAVFRSLLFIYSKWNREDLLRKAYQDGVRQFPKEADYDYMMGQYYVGQTRFQEGMIYLQRAISLLSRYGSERRSIVLVRSFMDAWEMLALCFYETGDLKSCVNVAVTVLRSDPGRPETLKLLLKAFRDDAESGKKTAASATQVLAFLENIYNLGTQDERQFVLQAAKEAEYGELIRALEKEQL